MTDYYELLGIEKNADEKTIKSAFRKLSMRYHPDRNPDDKIAEEKFKQINEAYQTLSDPEKRQMYDFSGADSSMHYNNPINDILRNMGFGINVDFDQVSNNHHSQKMQITQQINISLKDAVFGQEIDLNVPSYINCEECNGAGGNKTSCHKCAGAGKTARFLGAMQYLSVCVTCNGKGYVLTSTCNGCNQEGFKKKSKKIKLKIPAGIQNQTLLHIASDKNDKCDVFIVVNVMKHPKINRNGATLFSNEVVSCLDAMIGGKIKVETIDSEVELVIPMGTQHGQQLSIDGHGGILTSGRANHIVNVHIEIPKKLTPEQIMNIQQVKNKMENI